MFRKSTAKFIFILKITESHVQWSISSCLVKVAAVICQPHCFPCDAEVIISAMWFQFITGITLQAVERCAVTSKLPPLPQWEQPSSKNCSTELNESFSVVLSSRIASWSPQYRSSHWIAYGNYCQFFVVWQTFLVCSFISILSEYISWKIIYAVRHLPNRNSEVQIIWCILILQVRIHDRNLTISVRGEKIKVSDKCVTDQNKRNTGMHT